MHPLRLGIRTSPTLLFFNFVICCQSEANKPVNLQIYETKGLSLEQVDELYAKVAHAWQSPGFQPTVSFQDVVDVGADTRHMSLTDVEARAVRKRSTQHEEGIMSEKTL